MKVEILKSKTKNKRLRAIINNTKTVNFGSATGFTFFDGASMKEQKAYIARHKELNETWAKSGIDTAGFWARWYLWGLSNPSMKEQIEYFKNKFNITLEIKFFKKN